MRRYVLFGRSEFLPKLRREDGGVSMIELLRFWMAKNLADLAFAGIIFSILTVIFLVWLLVIVIKNKRDKKRKEESE